MPLRELTDNNLENLINFNSECRKIAEDYICKYYGNMYNMEDARLLAKYLLLEKKYTKDSIMNGYADDFIINRGKLLVTMKKSVRGKNEEIIEIKLKTKKGTISKDKLKIFIITLITTATIASSFALRFNNSYDKLKESSTIKLGQLASDDYLNDEANIINQNLHNFDSQGNYIPLYEGVASDIINVCIKDSSLFDVTIYNTYYGISNNRLDNFNTIWNTMKNYMANDVAFSPIYAKISNQSFLGYALDMLTKRGDIIHFMPEYQKSINAINEYNQVQSFEKLSKESKAILIEMMGKYEELGKELYKANKNTINDLVKEEKKLGGR